MNRATREGNLLVRYVRRDGQWCKVTKDSKKRLWTVARGWDGVVVAHDTSSYPFAYMSTWDDAITAAHEKIAIHA
jgi:hypothetical protein